MTTWMRIQSLVDESGISLRELANIAGVVPSATTKWKTGSSIRNDALKRIALHFGVSTDWLLTGDAGPPPLTPDTLPADSSADQPTARRLAAPSYTLTRRERVAQLAVAGYDAAAARRTAAQYEVLMQHVAGVAEGGESWQWHRDEIASIIDRHLPPNSDVARDNIGLDAAKR